MSSSNKKLFQKYCEKMNSFNKDKNVEAIYDSLLNGKNSYIRLTRKGSSSFDPTWIDVIENCLFDLGDIINNPREVTKSESSITPVELAKKIDGESVVHLASHTQYIKEVDENGNVVPSKILSHYNVEDIHTYENRFIATFIRRLLLFIEKRYEFIEKTVNLTSNDVLMVKNKSIVDGQEVEIETKITIKKDIIDESAKNAKEYIERILNMRDYIKYYYNSPFMKALKNEKDVRKPILQTNIIRKNPKYRKCYEAFLFIERFDSLGVSYHVDENYQTFDEKERGEINYLMLSSFLSVQNDHEFESIKKTSKTYKPKILTSIDDEKFVYGDLLKGPIEFVRVDEAYRNYLHAQVREDLPQHPNKYEKEYYKEEYDLKKAEKLEQKELDRLIARKEKEIAEWEKYVEKLIAQRELEEARQRQKELEELRKYHESLIEIRRRKIIEAAEANKDPYDGPIFDSEEEHKKMAKVPLEVELAQMSNEIPQSSETPSSEPIIEVNAEETVSNETPSEEVAPVSEENKPENENIEGVTPVATESDVNVTEADAEANENAEAITAVAADSAISEEQSEESQEEANAPIEVEPQESSEVESSNEEVPESVNESVKKPEPVIYRVLGNATVSYVDGHKEEVYSVLDSDEYEIVEPEETKEEPKVEAPVMEEKKEEPKVIEEKPKPKRIPPQRKKKETPKVEDKIDYSSKDGDVLKVIPGRFIVKTNEGYYISDEEFSEHKGSATVFDDFNVANQKKAKFGGKVIKL